MERTSPAEIRLNNSLTEITRHERRTLLGICALAYAIVKTGLLPSKISALGIEFTASDQNALISFISLIVLYFLLAFIIYATTDFLSWRIAFYNSMETHTKERQTPSDKAVIEQRQKFRCRRIVLWSSIPVSFIRTFFDYAIPILFGIYTIFTLLSTQL